MTIETETEIGIQLDFISRSKTCFKKRTGSEESVPTEQEISYENKKRLYLLQGLTVLRQIRAYLLENSEAPNLQDVLATSFKLAELIADFIIADRRGRLIDDIKSHPFVSEVERLSSDYGDQDWRKNHAATYALMSKASIQNLIEAADDMLIRTEEIVGALDLPDHKLDLEEVFLVLQEFLGGTNILWSKSIREKVFTPGTKHGGILSGGLVYLLLAQRVLEEYAELGLSFKPFAIVVDKFSQRVIIQTSEDDEWVEVVYILDDMIYTKGTMVTAFRHAGKHFSRADLISGIGIDYAKERAQRAEHETRAFLVFLLQDYCNLAEERRFAEAEALFTQAENYAQEHNLTLSEGWYLKRREFENS